MTQEEHRNYCHGKNKEELLTEIQSICIDKIYNGSYSFYFTLYKNRCINAHPYGSIEHFCQDLLMRKLSANIMHSYRLKTTNRNLIVRQITQLLDSDVPLCIMRKDVRHFFESVDPQKVMMRMRADGRVAMQTIQLCDMLLKEAASLGTQGVPRGLSISSAMTEFLMHKFDYTFTKLSDTLLYNRYVDDIIMISTSRWDMEAVQRLVDESLGAIGLVENKDKCYSLTYDEWKSGVDFEYLTYEMFIDSTSRNTKLMIKEKIRNI